MATIISPSLLAADFTNLGRDVEMINKSEADWLHLDIMDGTFVPNISFGFPVIDAVAKVCKKPLDVHFMIDRPERYIQRTATSPRAVSTTACALISPSGIYGLMRIRSYPAANGLMPAI